MPGESTVIVRARSVLHLVEVDVRALEHRGEQPDQPGARRRRHHRGVEQPVGGVGVRADPHAAAVAPGVAERGQRQVGVRLVVDRLNVSRNGSSRSLDSSATIATL